MIAARLHPDDLELLAELVADRLAERLSAGAAAAPALVDVKTIAVMLGVSPDFVYEHARELGGVKLSDSPKAPWRFDAERAREAMTARTTGRQSPVPEPPAPGPKRRRRRAKTTASGCPLLPYEGQEG